MISREGYDSERINRESDEIVEACRPLLAGKHPGVQGVALAELLAIWIAGYPESMGIDEQLIDSHIRGVRRLVPLYRKAFSHDDAAGN